MVNFLLQTMKRTIQKRESNFIGSYIIGQHSSSSSFSFCPDEHTLCLTIEWNEIEDESDRLSSDNGALFVVVFQELWLNATAYWMNERDHIKETHQLGRHWKYPVRWMARASGNRICRLSILRISHSFVLKDSVPLSFHSWIFTTETFLLPGI